MIVQGLSGRYQVDASKPVAETPVYRTYLCGLEGKEAGTHLLQVAIETANNGALDRYAFILDRLRQEAEEVEVEYAAKTGGTAGKLNYHLGFPKLVDTLVLEEQEDRRVNILQFTDVGKVSSMVPLQFLVHRDGMRVDLKTSVWVMGKLLKNLTLPHSIGIAVGDISLGNILIEPYSHYVAIFDWAQAQRDPSGRVAESVIRQEIQAAARCVIELLGGTPEGTDIPDDGTPEYAAYAAILTTLATSGGSDAMEAHTAFYAAVDSLWPHRFHTFTAVKKG